MQASTFIGDMDHNIDCTGDVCVGDHVVFERATFTGSFRNARFSGFELVRGEVVSDSYGAKTQQHTFTLLSDDGSTLRIKGRNLYANGTYRKPWADESLRKLSLDEKHVRGGVARAVRRARIEEHV